MMRQQDRDTRLIDVQPFSRAIRQGLPLDRLVISVHQTEDLQAAAAEAIPKGHSLPVLGLVNWRWAPKNAAFKDRLCATRESTGGEIPDANINTGELHIFGGSWSSCLCRAIRDALGQSLSHDHRQYVKATVYLDLSYMNSSKTTLMEELDVFSPLERRRCLVMSLQALTLSDAGWGSDPGEYEITRVCDQENSFILSGPGHDEGDYQPTEHTSIDLARFQIELLRRVDNKKVLLRFVTTTESPLPAR